jgi:hypothetical protein
MDGFEYQGQGKMVYPDVDWAGQMGSVVANFRAMNPAATVTVQLDPGANTWPGGEVSPSDLYRMAAELMRQGVRRPDVVAFLHSGTFDRTYAIDANVLARLRPIWRGDRWV